jgi:ubiquinone/menaquinone biosynthesis C-methylase UbiE
MGTPVKTGSLRIDAMHVRSFGRFLLEWGRLAIAKRQWPDDRLFLQTAYRTYLKRDPDEIGRQHYLEMLQRKRINRWGILRSITQSSEFKQVHSLPVHPFDAVHQARMMLIRHRLPPAEMIVDLGGAATGCPEGALLIMGYPHRPREILIVDLPPCERLNGAKNAEPSQAFVTADGVRVRYLYQSMAAPLPIADESVDLVFCGESIEHVTEAEANAVCREAYRVLKPDGYLCLDTPNASLTRLQSPDAPIHPEHKKEYQVHELRSKLERWGFEVVEAIGICPMPESLHSGVFSYEEMVHNTGLSERPEEGYLFYLKGVKHRASKVASMEVQ